MSATAVCRKPSLLQPLSSALQCSPAPCEHAFAKQLAHHLDLFREEGPGRPHFAPAWAASSVSLFCCCAGWACEVAENRSLHAFGAICGHQGPSGAIWGPSGGMWGHLEASGVIWSHFGTSGAIWGHLGSPGAIWDHLGPSEDIWSHLAPSGGIWARHLRPSGAIWEHLGPSEAI